jgi:anti-anti-sigma factor
MLTDPLFDGQDDPEGTLIHVRDGYGFEVRVVGRPDGPVVAVCGEVDLTTAGLLAQVIDRVCEGRERLVVDLSGTTSIDSSGVAVLVRAHELLGGRPGAVELHTSDPDVLQFFRTSGVDNCVTLRSDPL